MRQFSNSTYTILYYTTIWSIDHQKQAIYIYILIQRSKKSSKEIVQGDPLLRSSFLEAERPPANEIPAARLSLVGTCSEVHGHLEKHHEGVLRNGGVALACAQTPLLLFFLLFFEKKKWREERSPQGKRNNRRVPRATTWWKDQEREKKKKKKKRRERWWGLQFVARWPSSSPPPLSMPRNQESSRTRPERQPAMRLAFSSKADRGNRLTGEKRGPGRNLLSIGGGRENPHRGRVFQSRESCWACTLCLS